VGVKASPIGTDGLLLGEPKVQDESIALGNVESIPPQNSLVLTFWSGLTFGQANYGRMYLPYTGAAFTNGTPYIASATCTAIAAAGATFVGAINDIADAVLAGSGVVNISKVDAGTVKGVSTVRFGRLVDTQRRRRNRLTEDFTDAAV
jgi:hypothetical protein